MSDATARMIAPDRADVDASGKDIRALNERAFVAGAMRMDATLEARIAAAETVLKLALHEAFPGRIALVSSFGAESAVLLHLAASIAPGVPVVFLETGKHFAQTLSYRRRLSDAFGLTNVLDVRPDAAEMASEDRDGALWQRDADRCCNLRKVRPLRSALAGFDAWVTGRKHFQGGLRAALPPFEASAGKIKVNPLVAWSAADIDAYGHRYGLPAHPLVAEGFASIGCWPCTRPVGKGEGTRAGRWRGADKTECGIHQI